jgi:protocatechuate 3,4-dioxygenase beta subunit
MEERRLLDADAIRIGVVYLEEDSGSDLHGDTFHVLFEGGAPNTELTRLVIDGDHGPAGLSVGDMIFDTVKGGLGADEAFSLQILSSTGIEHVGWQVADGGSQLILNFTGFHAGEKLVFTIDVDEVQQFTPGQTNPQSINEGVDPIASGVEFQSSQLSADFRAPHYHDESGSGEFRNLYDPLFAGSHLLISQGNANGLPNDDYQGKRDRSTGAVANLQQVPLPVTIAGRVFLDNNLNLTQDGGDSGLAGVSLGLWRKQGGQWVSTGHTTTDNRGHYKFGLDLNLQPGMYQVRETQPAGYFSVGAVPGNVSGTPIGIAPSGDPDVLTEINIPLGDQHGVEYNFAEALPGAIRGKVWVDPNENCVFDSGESPLAGVTIQLLDQSGSVIRTTTTDGNGRYEFTDLRPGAYAVRQIQPAGYLQGGQMAGPGGGDASVTDLISQLVVGSGQTLIDNDFCELLPVSIAGHVWTDTKPNGALDPNESPISGVTIQLLDAQGSVIATRLTDVRGAYKFDQLRPGVYSVREIQPSGYFDGGEFAGSHGGDDSQDDLVASVTLRSGDEGLQYNFTELPAGKISGFVFRDGPPLVTQNGTVPENINELRDGRLTPDDLRLGGVVVELRHTLTGEAVLGEELLPGTYPPGPVRAVTDASGYYEFRGLPQGNYSIFEIHPEGYIDSLDTPGTTNGLAVNVGADVSPLLIQRFAAAGVSLNNDAILQVPLGVGQTSDLNNFSEIQVQTMPIIVPPPEARRPEPPPPAPFLPLLAPQIIVPPQVFIPPVGPQLITGGNGGVTWHLSIIDAGLPRVARRATTMDGLVFRPALWIEKTEWQPDRLKSGVWLIHGVEGAPHALFGLPEAIPIVGDFNGDGKDEIGVYCNGEWFLDLNGNAQWDAEDLWAKLGEKPDRPVTGDWDGDGKDDIGIFGPEWPGDGVHLENEPGLPDQDNQTRRAGMKQKPKNVPLNPEEATDGRRIMRLTAHGKERADLIDHVFQFGANGDIPIAGDWNGDGIRSVGIFREGKWHFDMDGDGRWSAADKTARFGGKGDLPVVGDFNGDGTEEIAIFRDGKWVIDSNGNRQFDAGDRTIEFGQAGDIPVAGDFDGDGTDEPAVYRPAP